MSYYFDARNDRTCFVLEGWEQDDNLDRRSLDDDASDPSLTVWINLTDAPIHWIDIFCFVITALGTESLTTLVLYMDDDDYTQMQGSDWIRVFDALPRVRSLHPKEDVFSYVQHASSAHADITSLLVRLQSMEPLS